MSRRFCSVCRREVIGPHSSSCNGPDQEILSEDQLEERRAKARAVLEAMVPEPPPPPAGDAEDRKARHLASEAKKLEDLLLYRRRRDEGEGRDAE